MVIDIRLILMEVDKDDFKVRIDFQAMAAHYLEHSVSVWND